MKNTNLQNNTIIKLGNLKSTYDQSSRVYSIKGIAPTIMSNSHIGGYTPIKILMGNIYVKRKINK